MAAFGATWRASTKKSRALSGSLKRRIRALINAGASGGAAGGGMRIDDGVAAFMAAALIRKHEGLALRPYRCPAGKPTIGYGHVILPHEADLRGGVTAEEAEALMLRDLSWAMFTARDVGRVLSDGQAAALASLVFNIGADAWRGSTIRRRVMAGDMAGAAEEFARWNKAGGKVLPGLVARRAEEAEIFGKG